MTNSESHPKTIPNPRLRSLEWVLSVLGAINCILIPILFSLAQIQVPDGNLSDIWPLPAIYFLEIISLGILCVIAVAKNQNQPKSLWSGIPWICSGILFAFVILGAWTIGFYLIPAMILFLIVGIMGDRRIKGDIALHLIYFVSGGIAQSILVFFTFIR
ncbi:hypothetical protein ACFLY4_06920 [Chloroflexota bacterium]